jgi:hypothetical protein
METEFGPKDVSSSSEPAHTPGKQESAAHSMVANFLGNALVAERLGRFHSAAESLQQKLADLRPEATFEIVGWDKDMPARVEGESPFQGYRKDVLNDLSLVLLYNGQPLVEIWSTGTTWKITQSVSGEGIEQFKRSLLDFSPQNLLRPVFESKIRELVS